MNSNTRTCDLHYLTLEQAKSRVYGFLNACIGEKVSTARIITGKDGHGNEPVLMTEIPRYVESFGVHIEYPDYTDEFGNLEKGSFTVSLDDIILYFESQNSADSQGEGMIDVKFIESFKKGKEESLKSESVTENLTKSKLEVVRRTKIELLNIVPDNSFCYNVLLRYGRKEEWVKCSSVSEVRSVLDEKEIIPSKRWEQELVIWDKKERLRQESQPKKFARYKGHTKKKWRTWKL